MLELILAIAIISVGLFAAATLVFSNQNLVDRNTTGLTALNLARESLESAKHLRDSNWLASNPFEQGMVGDYTATPVWAGSAVDPYFDFTADLMGDADARVVRLAAPSGFFANSNQALGIDGEATSFRRLVTFYPICDPAAPPNTDNPPVACGATVGIRVKAQVQWAIKGVTRDTSLYEDLYDWK